VLAGNDGGGGVMFSNLLESSATSEEVSALEVPFSWLRDWDKF
jgi:hypothetical protein